MIDRRWDRSPWPWYGWSTDRSDARDERPEELEGGVECECCIGGVQST